MTSSFVTEWRVELIPASKLPTVVVFVVIIHLLAEKLSPCIGDIAAAGLVKPHPLKARTAEEMAQIPTHYVMEKDKGMAETVAPFMPSPAEIAASKWLTEADVDVYATEYARTQFTGALQGYRVRRGSDPKSVAEMRTFSGRTIDIPSMFVAGKSDWGVYQTPGSVDKMRNSVCSRMAGFNLLDGAGHWVQQEQPEQVIRLLAQFLREHAR